MRPVSDLQAAFVLFYWEDTLEVKEDLLVPLSLFFTKWSEIRQENKEPLAASLNVFFQQWSQTLKEPMGEMETQQVQRFVDVAVLSSFFDAYHTARQPMLAAKRLGFAVNVWQTAGLKHNDVLNSQVLQWFLDPQANHGQGDGLLKQFLSLLPEKFQNTFIQHSRVLAESCPLGENSERVDIEIDTNAFLIFIEVKIDANEGLEQLDRYLHIVQRKASSKPWMVVYLTRRAELPSTHRGKQGLMAISWSQLAAAFLQYADAAEADNRSAWLVQQFAQHMQSF